MSFSRGRGLWLMYEDFFCERLSQLRREKEVSARDMSLSLGQNVNYINTIENHNSLPSMTAFFYICDYLRITPSQFFDDSISYPAQVQEILEGLKDLTKEELDAVQSVVHVLSKKSSGK